MVGCVTLCAPPAVVAVRNAVIYTTSLVDRPRARLAPATLRARVAWDIRARSGHSRPPDCPFPSLTSPITRAVRDAAT